MPKNPWKITLLLELPNLKSLFLTDFPDYSDDLLKLSQFYNPFPPSNLRQIFIWGGFSYDELHHLHFKWFIECLIKIAFFFFRHRWTRRSTRPLATASSWRWPSRESVAWPLAGPQQPSDTPCKVFASSDSTRWKLLNRFHGNANKIFFSLPPFFG